jgi:hypothetical protein
MIKRLPFILGLYLFVISFTSHAQVHFGGRAGINMSYLSIQPELVQYNLASTFAPKLTPEVSLLGYFEIGPYVGIQPEILYTRKGLKSKIDQALHNNNDTMITGEWHYSLDYFETPLMIKLSLNNEGFDPFIEFGAYYGYLFYAQYKGNAYVNDTEVLNEKFELEFPNDSTGRSFNHHEFGFKVGLGGTFKVSKGVMFFSFRFSQGFTDIINYEIKPSNYQKTYNRVFQLTLGYAFEIRSRNENKVFYY